MPTIFEFFELYPEKYQLIKNFKNKEFHNLLLHLSKTRIKKTAKLLKKSLKL
jgi:hypothetical protein